MSSLSQNIEFRRKLNESYQVCTFSEGKLLIHELEMIRRNRLYGLLPIEFMVADGKGQFWYKITGLQSLEDMQKTGRFGERELRTLIAGIKRMLEDVEGYLLREEGISLSQIYFSTDGSRVYFPYEPVRQEAVPLKDRLLEVLDELIKESGSKEGGYVQYLFHAYDVLRRENGCIQDALEAKEWEAPVVETPMEYPEICENPPLERLELNEEKEAPVKESFLHRIARNWFLDRKWEVKKKIRQYKDVKPEVWEDEFVVRPEEPVEDSRTQMIGENLIKRGVAYIHFEDNREPDVALTNSQYVLGKRKEYADLIVEDASVSRVHALIRREEDGYYLEDLNSLNGTFLNGTQLNLKEKVLLKPQDEIVVGTSRLVFRGM